MAASGLAVKLESAHLQFPSNLSVSESCKTAHSRGDHDRVVSPLTGGRQIRDAVALTPSLNQFPRHVTGNIERLSNGPPLCDKSRKFVRCRKEQAFRQFFDLYPNRELHELILALHYRRILFVEQ